MKTETKIIYDGKQCHEECDLFCWHKEFPQLNTCTWYNGTYKRGCTTLDYEDGHSLRHESCIELFGD